MFRNPLDHQPIPNTLHKTQLQKPLLKKPLNYPHSYNQSTLLLKQPLTKNHHLEYLIHIHPHSRRNKNTTPHIKRKKYPTIPFL
ncbi:stage II sporulation protein P, partial [Bacillus pumilus]|uniref:stage II sporulation protein P n=1 Tax=Bacillus pumilus TaxID=1408 RepID=UPI003703D1A2